MLKVIKNIFKNILIKRWAREITREISLTLEATKKFTRPEYEGCKNLAGLGGQSFRPYFISWNVILFQHKNYTQSTTPSKIIIQEQLFYGYFAPLEHWCDQNCQGPYYLWSDDSGIYRAFTDPVDDMLWNLTFDNQMPTTREIDQLVKNNCLSIQ